MSDDDELLSKLLHGDEAAFVELVGRYHAGLVRVAASIVKSPAVAEEAAQETWVAVVRGLERFEGRSSLRTWLYRICMNRARSIAKTEFRAVPVDLSDNELGSRFSGDGTWASPVQPWPDALEAQLDATKLAVLARRAIDKLPEAQRLVVTLRDVEGLTSSEVCDVLSISSTNQRVLLHRGRDKVRMVLDAYMREGQ